MNKYTKANELEVCMMDVSIHGGVGFFLIPGGGMSDWLWKKIEGYLDFPFIQINRRLNNT
jgi:hypothetical protein